MDRCETVFERAELFPALADATEPQTRARRSLICFSHLRWNFVFQRPQHLMSRFARDYEVVFLEEPLRDGDGATLETLDTSEGVRVLVPHVAAQYEPEAVENAVRDLLDAYLAEAALRDPVLWYYTPMALAFSDHIAASAIVYDCMDELSAFRGAPPELTAREARLLERCDVVFTGGVSLYESKRARHANVHAFPSSVDVAHFAKARAPTSEPADQAGIPAPRIGFFGVLDERLDTALLAGIAAAHPEWSIVLLGPIVKIDPATLPRAPNLHYLGPKAYDELPAYLAGWRAALMPFAMNESTRYISPTKTPEYLAGGVPVVSTPVHDVVRQYGDSGVVRIAAGAPAFCDAIANAIAERAEDDTALRETIDRLLAPMSWDRVWQRMGAEMDAVVRLHEAANIDPSRVRRARSPNVGGRRAFDCLVVGAGFSGSVVAERLAADAGQRVLVIDRRPHIGGNAYDCFDDAGILIHRYGPHIFHTNATRIVEYLSRFTEWRPYEHRVLASVGGELLPIPINLTTLNRMYGVATPADAEAFLAARAEPIDLVRSSEDVVLSQVGRELYETFFRGYTRKQWGRDPSRLDKSVTSRIPTRTSTDDRYFTDRYQMMPLRGYTRMFENMLDHPNIAVQLGVSYEDVRREHRCSRVVYTGPVDEFFGCRFGKLPYRSLEFRHETLDREWFQPVAVVNYPSETVPHTRVTEYKHLTGQRAARTSISWEFPRADGDPFYPVPSAENEALYRRYRELADATTGVEFVGRLATYRYYNMDQVVGQALALYKRLQPAIAAA